jgi:hypothetical protein
LNELSELTRPVAVEDKDENNIIQMQEKVARTEMLFGSTYKVKTPQPDHALSGGGDW